MKARNFGEGNNKIHTAVHKNWFAKKTNVGEGKNEGILRLTHWLVKTRNSEGGKNKGIPTDSWR